MKSLNLKTSGVILFSAWIATAPLLNVKAQQASKPIVIESQGSFVVGGSVITNPGTFDPITRTPEGQTFHGDHAYITYSRRAGMVQHLPPGRMA